MAKVSVVEITKSLKGIEFPADKDELIDYARENGAEEEVLDFMQEMPEEEFESMSDVMSAFGDANKAEADE